MKQWIKRITCTPMQRLKIWTNQQFGDAVLYSALCWIERHLLVRNTFVDIWQFTHKDQDGAVISQEFCYNFLYNQGQSDILDNFFRGTALAAPSNFQLGLAGGTPALTDTPASIASEPVGNGYTRLSLTRDVTGFPTLALDAGDFMVTSKTVTFGPASGGSVGPVTQMFLITTNATPRLVAWAPLSISRTLSIGETVDCAVSIKMSE